MESRDNVHGHWLLAAFVFLLVNLSQGQTFPYMTSNVTEVAGKSFDYIVVGGGTAGCPLAATLSENFTVLVIERGDSPYDNPLVMEVAKMGYTWLQTDEFSSTTQSFYSQGNEYENFRGRVLGGTSSINVGFYGRGSKDFINETGWDKELVEQAYEWVENSGIVFQPQLAEWQETAGFRMLQAGVVPYNGYTFDHLEGTKIGGSLFDNSGKRHPPSDLLTKGNSDNIIVLLNATVSKINFDDTSGTEITTLGVSFIRSNGNPNETYEVYLNKGDQSSNPSGGDVILSAGTLGSPQILLLSGIGPKIQLEKFNITLVSELEGVGQKVQDNPTIFLSIDNTSRKIQPVQAAAVAKDLEFIIESPVFPTNVSTNDIQTNLLGKLAFPNSEGTLELNSTDPRVNPLVDFNYLATQHDLDGCARLVPLMERIVYPPPFPLPEQSQEELEEYCKKYVRSFYHYHGGCTVGSVVDEDYKVYGVKGLRVVDFSTFLQAPGTNPIATLLMLGRYQGIKMLGERVEGSVFSI